jgi:hypothetical protein
VDEMRVNGTHYNEGTDMKVIEILESARKNDIRIRIFSGDTETGQEWLEEYNIMGYVGRTTGRHSPILVHNKRSFGGGLISIDCILKITINKQVVYQHPNYKPLELKVYKHNTPSEYPYGVNDHANFKTQAEAERWVEFMMGRSNRK